MRIRQWWEGVRSSLFYVPLLFSIVGAVVAELALLTDTRVSQLPDRLTATVDSARSVLSVIAGATLTFAAIAFSVSLLLISAASSQFSPRVVHGLFRDPFNKRVMGVVIGTFVYCLVVMRAVRGPLEDAGTAVVPSLSVLLAVVLGLVAILAIVAFINHSAHTMEVSSMLHTVTEEALEQLGRAPEEGWEQVADADVEPPDGEPFVVTFDQQGWVQAIDHGALLAALEPGGTLALDTTAGRYGIKGAPMARIWPTPEDTEATARQVRLAIATGPSRSMHQDRTFGVRQLADVALKALSPGINDPTTAQDALFHMASVVRAVLATPAHERVLRDGDRRLLAPENDSAADVVGLAFDEVRLASVGQPTVLVYLLEILRVLIVSLPADTPATVLDALRAQAGLVRELAELGDLPDVDRQRIRDAHDSRFGAV